MQIRPALHADWEQIWSFLAGVLARGETYTYPQDISEPDARALWMVAEPWHVLVAELGDEVPSDRPALRGRIVGLVRFGPNQPGRGAHVANASFVVDPAASGLGVGRALAEETLVQAKECGFRAMQFNAVVETNTRAVALWRSLGFDILATVPEAFDHPTHGYVGMHVMHRFL